MKKPLPVLRRSTGLLNLRPRARSFWMLGIALALCSFPLAASAFTNVTDVFAGTNGARPTSVSASASVLSGSTQTLSIGPGFTATSTVPVGVVYTQTLEINDPSTSVGGLRPRFQPAGRSRAIR